MARESTYLYALLPKHVCASNRALACLCKENLDELEVASREKQARVPQVPVDHRGRVGDRERCVSSNWHDSRRQYPARLCDTYERQRNGGESLN